MVPKTPYIIRMPQILFDPPSEDSPQRGGVLEGEKRTEYVELCKQMTRMGSDLGYGMIYTNSMNYPRGFINSMLDNYRRIRDRILQILEEDVRRYIDTLPTKDKAELLKDFDIILSTVPTAENDPDPLSTINVLSFQISILFTEYEIKQNKDFDEIIVDNYLIITKNYYWKNNVVLINVLRTFGRSNLNYLLNPYIKNKNLKEKPPIFMVFLGFLKIDEIVESYLNNVFFLGLSYKSDYIDGVPMKPFEYLYHDIAHFNAYEDDCMDTIFIPTLREFYEYVKGYDKSIRYSINFALFIHIHEAINCISNKDLFISQHLLESIHKSFTKQFLALCDLQMLGKAIPEKYRILVEGSDILLKEEKVMEYLDIALERFARVWNEFIESKNSGTKGGRRRVHLTKKNRRKKKLTRKRKVHS